MERRTECAGTQRCAGARRRPRPLQPALIALAAMFLMAACQAYIQQYAAIVEAEHKVMVYTSDLTEPYEKLGDLSYTDALNGETIDTDHINEKLRQMAIERWSQQVDAIIHVSTKVGGSDAPTISVTGEAVRVKDPCSGCRHNFSSPSA